MLLFLIIPLFGILARLGSGTKITIFNAGLLCLIYGLIYPDVNIIGGSWIEIGNLTVNWELKFDKITKAMLFPILLINFLVQLFSVDYMEGDPHVNRYNLFLNLFVATMILMVTANNLFVLFVGWEGVGLASYLLINFWYTRIYANLAGIKAFLTNRIGDWGLTLGLIFYWIIFGGFNLELQPLAGIIAGEILNLLGIAVLLGAITKSAQIGLHSWLTRSMEGPTPVSALLHAATMVTAGVYLMLRMNLILEWTALLPLILCWIGGLSALGGAIGGVLEYDIKKIIAYSTISQLGYMFIAIGSGAPALSLWHLINHACFKALLFLSGGALIHSLFGIQDIRKFGNIGSKLPVILIAFLIGNLSIMAIPFMTGWWTKDQILLVVFQHGLIPASFLYILIYLAAFITAAYSVKLFISSFSSRPRLSSNNFNLIHVGISFNMEIVMLILMILAIGLGYLTSNLETFGPERSLAMIHDHLTANVGITIMGIFALLLITRQSKIKHLNLSNFAFLEHWDLILLRTITSFVAPCSTFLYRNYQGALEVYIGGTGIFRIIEGISFRIITI